MTRSKSLSRSAGWQDCSSHIFWCQVWVSPCQRAGLNHHTLHKAPPSALSSSVSVPALLARETPKHISTQQDSGCSKRFHTRELILPSDCSVQGFEAVPNTREDGHRHPGVSRVSSDGEAAGRKSSRETMAFGKLQEGEWRGRNTCGHSG